jgi:hypothetical protein
MTKQYGIHLTCPLLDDMALDLLVSDLSTQFAVMEGRAQVVAHGRSCKQNWAFVEVIWTDEEVDQEFLEELKRDSEILDYCAYPLPLVTDEQLALLEQV